MHPPAVVGKPETISLPFLGLAFRVLMAICGLLMGLGFRAIGFRAQGLGFRII